MHPQPPPPSLEAFVDGVLARAQLNQLDPGHRHFDIGRGARGVLHITPQKLFRDGKLVRKAKTTLCRGASVVETDLYMSTHTPIAPTCRRCQQVAERIILRRKSRGKK